MRFQIQPLTERARPWQSHPAMEADVGQFKLATDGTLSFLLSAKFEIRRTAKSPKFARVFCEGFLVRDFKIMWWGDVEAGTKEKPNIITLMQTMQLRFE